MRVLTLAICLIALVYMPTEAILLPVHFEGLGQPGAYGLGIDRQTLAQRLQRRQRARGVDQLVGTAQRWISQARVAASAPSPGPLLLVAGVVEVVAEAPQVSTDLTRVVDHALRRHRVTHNHRATGAHDARLLAPDTLAVGPEEFGVVDVDAGNDRTVGIDDVGGIQAATEANFQDGHVQPRLAHQVQYRERGELEIGQRNLITRRARTLHRLEMRQQIACGHYFAVDTTALLEVHQVRRGIDAGAVAGLQCNGLQHGAG